MNHSALCGMKEAESLTLARCYEKRLRLDRHGPSGNQLATDKVGKRTDCGEGCAINIVVIHDQAKLVFQCGDECDDGHRVQFRHRAEKWGVAVESGAASIQTQDFVNNAQNFLCYVQFEFPKRKFANPNGSGD